MTRSNSVDYLARLREVLDAYPYDSFEAVVRLLAEARDEGRRIYVMGNGGSATTASHWVCDMNKGCAGTAPRFRMFALNDSVPTVLAYANDASYEAVFVEQLKNHLEPDDLAIGISASGNSPNVVGALQFAAEIGARTAGLVGCGGGRVAAVVDVALTVPSSDMQLIEDVHVVTMHMLMQRFAAPGAGC